MALQGNVKPEATFNEDEGAGSVEDRDWNSVKRSVCMIDTKSAIGKGTGFVGKLEIAHPFEPIIELVLVTAYHVLPDTDSAQKALFYFDRVDGEGFSIKGKNLIKEDRNSWKGSKVLDFSLFSIKPDALSSIPGAPIEPLSLNKCESVDSTLASADQLFAIHHPEKPPKPYEYLRCKSAYLVTHVKGPILTHKLSTYGGSSGAPLFKVVPGEREPVVVAIHAGCISKAGNPQVNYGFRMSDITHFTMKNEIKNEIPSLDDVLRKCTGDQKLAEVEPQPRQVAADNREKKTKESKIIEIPTVKAVEMAEALKEEPVLYESAKDGDREGALEPVGGGPDTVTQMVAALPGRYDLLSVEGHFVTDPLKTKEIEGVQMLKNDAKDAGNLFHYFVHSHLVRDNSRQAKMAPNILNPLTILHEAMHDIMTSQSQRQLEFSVESIEYALRGRLDCYIMNADAPSHVIDFKWTTSPDRPTARNGLQLLLYQWLIGSREANDKSKTRKTRPLMYLVRFNEAEGILKLMKFNPPEDCQYSATPRGTSAKEHFDAAIQHYRDLLPPPPA